MSISKLDTFDRNNTLHAAVHDGPFHGDEVFAIAAMCFLFKDVDTIRTRDPELLASRDIRIDVGDNYDPVTADYDHHMSWFKVRHKTPNRKRLSDGKFREYKEGPLRAGFGLIWLHHGIEICKAVVKKYTSKTIQDKLREFDFVDVQQSVDNGIVAYIDAIDNGEMDAFNLGESPFRANDISRVISSFNPSTMEQQEWATEDLPRLYHDRFMEAVNFAKNQLRISILNQVELIYFREKFMTILRDFPEDGKVLVLDSYIPWSYAYGRAGDLTNKVDMVVYPNSSGTWMCQTPYYYKKRDGLTWPSVLNNGEQRRYKHQAPENICGLRDEILESITSVPGAVFVHKGGHLGAAKTKEAAVQLAHYFIDNHRE